MFKENKIKERRDKMAYFVGIDIGGTNTEIGILNEKAEILKKKV